MNFDKNMFIACIAAVIYSAADINNAGIYIGRENRSSGKLCIYLDTRLNVDKVYFRPSELGSFGNGCPIIYFNNK